MARRRTGRQASARVRAQFAGYRRWLTLALIGLLPLVIHWGTDEAFNLPKVLVLAVAASVLAALFVREWLLSGRPVLPSRWWSLALLALVVAVAIVTATSDALPTAVLGGSRRFTGGVFYVSLVVLAVSVAADFETQHLRSLVRAVVVGGGLVAVYGLLQLLGVDPVPWVRGGITSTIGNNNFVSGHMAIVATLAAWLGLHSDESKAWRITGGLVAALSLAALIGAASLQGFVAVAGGLVVMGVLWLLAQPENTIRPAFVVAGLGGLLLAGAGGALALGVDPAAALRGGVLDGGAVARIELARSGLSMWADHPVVGVGMDQFGSFVREYRPPEFADQVSISWGANEAHSVPVNMLATGGLVLFVPYLAVMVLPLWLAWRGFRNGTADRPVLAGLVGGFTAYLLQAFVSVDVPPLALTGWVLAGALVVASGAAPWAGGATKRTRPAPSFARMAGTAAAWALVLSVVIGALQILDASSQIRLSNAAREADYTDVAVAAAESATATAGWWPEYWLTLAQAHTAAGDIDAILSALDEGYERNPRDFAVVLAMARLHASQDMDPATWYGRALELDPHSDELAEEAAPHVEAEG